MKTPLPTLDAIDVAEPCLEQWDRMTGGRQTRFCGTCQKHVHNLSAMSRQQAEAIASEGGYCVRFARDRLGRIVTANSLLARLFPVLWTGLVMFLSGCKTMTQGIPGDTWMNNIDSPPPLSNQSAPKSDAKSPEPAKRPPVLSENAPGDPRP